MRPTFQKSASKLHLTSQNGLIHHQFLCGSTIVRFDTYIIHSGLEVADVKFGFVLVNRCRIDHLA